MRRRSDMRILAWMALLLVVTWSFGPILIIVASSFKLERNIFTYVPKLIFLPKLDNYSALIHDYPTYWASLRSSAITTFGAAILVVFLSFPAAYSYSRLKAKGLSLTALFLIAVRMFPPIIITIPLYPLCRGINLIDTPLILILVYSAFQVSLSVWILKSFLDGVPKELEEAAWIDGCNRAQSFLRVLMPLIAPGIIASIIFVCLFAWNDFVFAFLFTGTRAKTAPVLISEMLGSVGEGGVDWGTVFAAATIQLVPILFFVWFIQKRLVKGLTIGAMKA